MVEGKDRGYKYEIFFQTNGSGTCKTSILAEFLDNPAIFSLRQTERKEKTAQKQVKKIPNSNPFPALYKVSCAMVEYLSLFKEWVIVMGERHGVDPLFLGVLYLDSKVFFFSCLGWVFTCIKKKKPLAFPLLFSSLSFSIPYSYLIIAGRNISFWVYLLIGFMFLYGAYSIWKKISTKLVSPGGPVNPLG